MTTALITRPLPEAEETAKILQDKGFSTIIDPLLTIHIRMDGASELEKSLQYPIQTIVLTSANGAKALGHITEKRELPILAVGASTAAAAKKLGFHKITVTGENVRLLMDHIVRSCPPKDGDILYISADVITVNLPSLLAAQGFAVKRIIGYYSEETTVLSEKTITLLENKSPSTALFYSKRTAEIFMQLAANYDLSHITAFALSPAIAEVLHAKQWQGIYSADHPTQESLMALIEKQVV
jgi:uroporphyrinogen-III synthase